MECSITVSNLSKQYRIGALHQSTTFREALVNVVTSPFRRQRSKSETIWALKDVSFEVKEGEVVGIIGRNGAGKTTLLKLISRITYPTSGRINVRGRVASLLEVGTGFHPELTGRENIYLNGSILGMTKKEINAKFDEIVAFAEVEKFIDTPVKRYSSGMYVRLAFAVAAHLEPEILLIDEVLSVGDSRFQRKCLGKMEDVGKRGRIVLFVSHNMPAIARLCERVLLLEQGSLVKDDVTSKVIGAYLQSDLGTSAERRWPGSIFDAPGDDIVRLRAVRVITRDGTVSETFDIRHPVGIQIEYYVLKPGRYLVPDILVLNGEGIYVFHSMAQHDPMSKRPRPAGLYRSTCWIPGNLMAEGTFVVRAQVCTLKPVIVHVDEYDVVSFQIIDTTDGDSARGDFGGTIPGVVRPLLQWQTDYEPIEAHSPESIEWR